MFGVLDDLMVTISLLALTAITYKVLTRITELGEDLRATTYLLALAIASHVIPPIFVIGQIIKVIFGLPLFFFVTGYAFVSALFPKRGELSHLERFVVGIGMSIAVTVFDGFALNYTSWGYRPNPILATLSLFTLLFLLIAQYRRSRLSREEQFYFSFEEELAPLREESLFLKWLKASIQGKKEKPKIEIGIEESLIIAMIICVIITASAVAYLKLTQEPERFTSLYVLGKRGKAEDYPTELYYGIPTSILVGVENHEHHPVNYTLEVILDGKAVNSRNVSLEHEQKWLEWITVESSQISTVRNKLEFLLYREAIPGPYRSVHLWVNSTYNYDFIKNNATLYAIYSLPSIKNGDMESLDGWIVSKNNYFFTWNLSSDVYVSYSHSLEIAYPARNDSYAGYYAAVNQVIQGSNRGIAILSLLVKDSYDQNITKGFFYKQVLINDRLIWEDDVAENEGWIYLKLPVILEQNNTLALRVIDKAGLNKTINWDLSIQGLRVWWEDIKLEDLSELPRPENILRSQVDFRPPTSRVLPLPRFLNMTSFLVKWTGSDDASGIASYDIEYSTDGINYKLLMGSTIENSTTFTGADQATYYFRSRAMDNAGNQEPVHETPDAAITIDTVKPKIWVYFREDKVNSTYELTVGSDEPLASLTCTVNPFGYPMLLYPKLNSTSEANTTWRGSFYVAYNTTYEVHIAGKDFAGNYGEETVRVKGW